MIGRTVGNYVIRSQVGEGGMGVVYVAEHPQISRRVAVKVLHPDRAQSPELVHRFFNEARAASEIHNEHIVEVLDFGRLDDTAPYLVMEWLEGQSLAGLLRVEPRLPPARAARIVRGVCQALRAAHGKGVVHRDLKPDNVFLVPREGEPDFVKVLDFGIAKLVTPKAAADFQTQTGAIMGTPAYMSPEQCRGAKDVDHRTDIYSVGVMAYQMLTGRLPFVADSLGELLFKHLGETPPAPEALVPSLPAGLAAIVARTLAKDPGQRPTLVELGAAMDAVVTGADAARAGAAPAAFDAHAATAAAMPASSTTLGGSASELGLEKRIPTATVAAPARKGPSGALVAGVVVAAGVVAAVVGLGGGRTPAKPPAAVSAPPPAPVVAPPPPAAPSQPATVEINVRATPSTAALTLDGAPIANPFHAELPADAHPHAVVASAPGHRAVTESLTFERSRDLVLDLAPVAAAEKRRGPAKAGAQENQEKKGYRGSKLDIDTDFPGGSK
jgi:serine/threonine-protein kinase